MWYGYTYRLFADLWVDGVRGLRIFFFLFLCPAFARGPLSSFSLTLPRLECFITFCLFFIIFFLAGAKQLPFHQGYVFFCLSAWAFIIPYLPQTFWKKKEESATCIWHLSVGVRVWLWHVGEVMSWGKERVNDMGRFYVYNQLAKPHTYKSLKKKRQRWVKIKNWE